MNLGLPYLAPMPPDSPPGIASILYDNSIADSSWHVEMSKSKVGIWPDHITVADDGNCDCDSFPIGPNVVFLGPDPSPPVIIP